MSVRQGVAGSVRGVRDPGEIELLEPDGGERSLGPAATTVTAGGGGRRRQGLVALGAVLAVVATLTFLGSGGSDHNAAPTSVSRPASVVTTAPRQPPTTVPTTAVPTTAAPEVPLVDTPTGLALVTFGTSGMWLTDFDTGVRRLLAAPEANEAYQMIPRTGGVVVGGGSFAYVPLPAGDRSHVLSNVDLIVPSADPGRVWVISYPSELREIDMNGATTTGPLYMPIDAYLVGGVTSGVIVGGGGGIFLVPSDGGPPTRVATGNPVAAAGHLLASYDCGLHLDCRLHLHDLATGRDLVLVGPDGGSIPEPYSSGAFNSDGTRLAFVGQGPTSQLLVIDTATGESIAAPSGPMGLEVPSFVWSPDGGWLFWAVGQEDVRAWRVGAPESSILPIDLGTINTFAVVPGATQPA